MISVVIREEGSRLKSEKKKKAKEAIISLNEIAHIS